MAKRRLLITVDQEIFDLLKELSRNIHKPMSRIAKRLLDQHHEELREFNEWISKQEPGSRKHKLGIAAYEQQKPVHRDLVNDIELIERHEQYGKK